MRLKIAVICPSEIAFRRFMPALQLIDAVEFVGIGICTEEELLGEEQIEKEEIEKILKAEKEKAVLFIQQYGGNLYESYKAVVSAKNVDAVYIPLPPALHYKWAKKALENGKHVLVEKPSTISLENTKEIIEIAEKKKLALHENYMFIFHDQLDEIEKIIKSGEIGDVRLYRIDFGFPMRAANDFRYNKALGGGSLIDAGGYTIKYATRLLGKSVYIKSAQLGYVNEFEVDMYGSATFSNKNGMIVQAAFGMDNDYKCRLEVWGSKGTLTTGRVLTAPVGYIPEVVIHKNNTDEIRKLPADDAFKKSIEYFLRCINDSKEKKKNYMTINKQAELVRQFQNKRIYK